MTTAFVIIDVQQGMFGNPGYDPHDGEGVVARLADVLARARASEMPIHFVQHDGGADSPLAKDGPGFAFRKELTPLPNENVTVKQHCSAFQDTDFIDKLRAAGIDHLIIGGMQTEFCVDTAVRGAFERGLKVTLISDGHTTFDGAVLTAEQMIAHHNDLLSNGNFAKLVAAMDVAIS